MIAAKPVATYRVQLNRNFNFNHLKELVPYLAKLGISHIYASPIFQAKQGSTHGYDVLDPNKISEDLGGRAAFEESIKEAAAYGLEWLQDIVPNHVAYSTENHMITDIMQKGSGSKYHNFFDVDWNHPARRLKDKILAPFLATSYEEALKKGDIKLAYQEDHGFIIKYKNLKFPVKTEFSQDILREINKTTQLSYTQIDGYTKRQVEKLYNNPINLDNLLAKQVYALDQWTVALKEINYRRFFDILDLICLHTEAINVFEDTHQLVFGLLSQGNVSGVRIDHIDGLHNPEQYIERLRQKAPEAYIVVEKILTGEEQLPHNWHVHGTTGYDFLNYLIGVFIDKNNEKKIDKFYRQFSRNKEDFKDLLYDCKKLVIEQSFSGDIDNLTRLMLQVLRKKPYGKGLPAVKIREALVELFATFPVYRTYISENNTGTKAQGYFRRALLQATQQKEGLYAELEAIEKLLEESKDDPEALQIIMRLQQFTGAVMAKGFEDTVLYRYNRLLSLNDVGSNPAKFGTTPEELHAFNHIRQNKWPLTLNASSTHDTKHGEDARARLNVLSEIPAEFGEHLERWSQLNDRLKKKVQGDIAPDYNEEYYIYQTLIGSLPFSKQELPDFIERLKTHITKALREAKVHSDWVAPQTTYEEAVIAFTVQLFNPENSRSYLEDFLPFQEKVSTYGVVNSLAQTLLKITSPGVPDFYQGSELWNLNMVDPDSRRPVNFKKCQQILKEVTKTGSITGQKLLNSPQDGMVKLYLIYNALQARQKNKILYIEGEYIPLKIEGPNKNHIVAFCRKKTDTYSVTVVPRLLASLTNGQVDKLDEIHWEDTYIRLPPNVPKRWQNIFEQQHYIEASGGCQLRASELFDAFPVALLLSGDLQ